jgi:hypothetical protein
MIGGKKKEKDPQSHALVEMQARLKPVFEKIPNEISLYLFTSPGRKLQRETVYGAPLGEEAAMAIFEDIINPYRKKEE